VDLTYFWLGPAAGIAFAGYGKYEGIKNLIDGRHGPEQRLWAMRRRRHGAYAEARQAAAPREMNGRRRISFHDSLD